MGRLKTIWESLKQERQIWPLLMMICCTMMGSSIVVPILSVYAASFGVTSTMVGMLVTIFGIGRLLANFPSGWLSQQVGRRPLLVAGALVIAAGSLGAALTTDFLQLCFWRFVQGVGSGMYLTVSLAALADISTASTRARLVGLYQLALQMGATVGAVFGGYIAKLFGLTAPFWALLIISLMTALLAVFSFRDSQVAPARSLSGALAPEKRGMFSAPFFGISFISAVSFFTRTACMFQLIPLIAQDSFGMDVAQIGYGIGIIAITMMMMMPFSQLVIEKAGARLAVVYSMIGMAVALLAIIAGPQQYWFWLSMVLYGITGGFNGPAIGAYSIAILPRRQYGSGMGLQRTLSDIGFVAGPVVIGLIDDFSGIGHPGGIMANAALLVVATLIFLLVSSKRSAAAKEQ
jgi:DHA1 family multidrug resistance protein-like MFS transporter